jgi:hypothetical protein
VTTERPLVLLYSQLQRLPQWGQGQEGDRSHAQEGREEWAHVCTQVKERTKAGETQKPDPQQRYCSGVGESVRGVCNEALAGWLSKLVRDLV